MISDVFSERVSVSQIETLTIWRERVLAQQRRVLAHAVEHDDRVVERVAEDGSTAATVAAVTTRPVSEYTPIVMMTSWNSATIVGTAYLNSNRNARYATIRNIEKMTA